MAGNYLEEIIYLAYKIMPGFKWLEGAMALPPLFCGITIFQILLY